MARAEVVEINEILQWAVPIVIGVFLAVFSYINREGFRRGSAKGQSEVTTNIISNTIKELESTKKEIDKLTDALGEQNVKIVRLQERLRYMGSQINELKDGLGMPRNRSEDVEER